MSWRSILVIEDMLEQREGLLSLGFWALLIYRFGHARLRIKSRLLRLPWTIVYMIVNKIGEMLFGIEIGVTAKIGRRLAIEHHGGIVIHGSTVIGDDCLIRQGVTLGNRSIKEHGDAPTLGNRVQIGAGAKILGKVTIGDGASIGANAVVLQDVPPGASAVGVPARIIEQKKADS